MQIKLWKNAGDNQLLQASVLVHRKSADWIVEVSRFYVKFAFCWCWLLHIRIQDKHDWSSNFMHIIVYAGDQNCPASKNYIHEHACMQKNRTWKTVRRARPNLHPWQKLQRGWHLVLWNQRLVTWHMGLADALARWQGVWTNKPKSYIYIQYICIYTYTMSETMMPYVFSCNTNT